jgi:hypothetical protein
MARMDIQLGGQRIFALEERVAFDEVRQRAMDKRTTAFGGGLGGLLQRPKSDDVTLLTTQRRVEPFWHVSCRAHYVYDRTRDYTVPASAADVKSVALGDVDYPINPSGKAGPSFVVPVLEHCREEFVDALYIDGVSGAAMTDGPSLVAGTRTQIDDTTALAANDTVVVSPEQRASSVVRQLLSKMLRPLQADVVHEEALNIEALELFYRPVWAFEFAWAGKDKRGVIEIDGLTGQARQTTSLGTQISRVITRDALFDIGADTVGLLVPGGSIAVKVARAAIDRSY